MRTILALLIACSSIAVASSAAAQQVAVGTGKPAPASSAFRKLAPGGETTIRAADRPVELISRHDLAEILAANPNYGVREGDPAPSPALKVRFGHDVRGLDFTFKPLRMILVDVPNSLGKMDQKLVWYLVYHVNNTDADKPFLFAPKFTLTDLDRNVSYADQLIPVAEPAIRRREDPNRKLLNTYTIAGEIPPNGESWAVVTWTDLPSTLRRISIT